MVDREIQRRLTVFKMSLELLFENHLLSIQVRIVFEFDCHAVRYLDDV
jgi:hypothetical protein